VRKDCPLIQKSEISLDIFSVLIKKIQEIREIHVFCH